MNEMKEMKEMEEMEEMKEMNEMKVSKNAIFPRTELVLKFGTRKHPPSNNFGTAFFVPTFPYTFDYWKSYH